MNHNTTTSKRPTLSDIEEVILLGIQRLGGEAFGAQVRQTISDAGRPISEGTFYVTVSRLEERGYLIGREGEVAPRGGRAKRYLRPTPQALSLLEQAEMVRQRLRMAI